MERMLVRRTADYRRALAPQERTLEHGTDAIWSIFPGTLWNAWLNLFVQIRNRPGLQDRSATT